LEQREVELLIVGGGPAGYAAAGRGRQLGLRTLIVEKDAIGGTCLNRGCIPTKSLLESASLYERMHRCDEFGLEASHLGVNYPQVMARKDRIVKNLVGGLGTMLQHRGIEIAEGEARFADQDAVVVDGETPLRILPQRTVICTGTVPAHLPMLEPDGRFIFDSDSILLQTSLPESMIIVGGGVIGSEFACIFQSLGVAVTIVELTDGLIPGEDQDLRRALLRELKKKKIKVQTNAKITDAAVGDDGVRVFFEQRGQTKQLHAHACLSAVGRRPVLPSGIELAAEKSGFLRVGDDFRTSVPQVYAAGDVIGGLQLAHLAFFEGIAAVSSSCGEDFASQWHVPRCVYTDPETASVGLSEQEAEEKFGEAIVGMFSLKGNGKAMILGSNSGFCKVVADPSGRVVGFHMIGPHATEMIAGAVVALEQEMTLQQWSQCIHPHPTVSESIHESVLSALGLGLHA